MADALGSSAAADDGDAVKVAQTVSPTSAASDPTRITNPSTETHATALLQLDNLTDETVTFPDLTKAALVATFAGHDGGPVNGVGVLGLTTFGTGVEGRSDGYRGVSGWSLGVGVHGEGAGGGSTGVEGIATSGVGVSATATTGKALVATSDSGEAVYATSTDNVAIYGNGSFGVVGNGVSRARAWAPTARPGSSPRETSPLSTRPPPTASR